MKWNVLLSLSLLCIGGFMSAVYEQIANKNMWALGEYFRLKSIMPIVGGVLVLASVMLSIILNPWWTGILVFVLGLIFCQVLIMLFKESSQVLSITLIVIAAILTFFFA